MHPSTPATVPSAARSWSTRLARFVREAAQACLLLAVLALCVELVSLFIDQMVLDMVSFAAFFGAGVLSPFLAAALLMYITKFIIMMGSSLAASLPPSHALYDPSHAS